MSGRRRSVVWYMGALLLVIAGCWLAWSGLAVWKGRSVAPRPPAPPDESVEYDVTPRGIELIPPGVVIDEEPPRGWTHLIIKSQPRVGEAGLRRISSMTARLAGLLFTATLAKVDDLGANAPARFRLTSVAMGVGTRIGGRDTIISPETQEPLGANLDFLARQVLKEWYTQQQSVRVVVRSATTAVYDTPAIMLRDDRHRHVVLRYCLLLDADRGHLQTLLWPMDLDEHGDYQKPFGPVEWLVPNKIEDCVLRVDPRQFTFGIPTATAFATTQVPQGVKKTKLDQVLGELASLPTFTPPQARQLEASLRTMLKSLVLGQ